MLFLDISFMKFRLTPLCLFFFLRVACSSFLKRFCKILTRPVYRRCCILVIKAPLHLLFLRQDLVWLLLTRVLCCDLLLFDSGSFCCPWMLSQLLWSTNGWLASFHDNRKLKGSSPKINIFDYLLSPMLFQHVLILRYVLNAFLMQPE